MNIIEINLKYNHFSIKTLPFQERSILSYVNIFAYFKQLDETFERVNTNLNNLKLITEKNISILENEKERELTNSELLKILKDVTKEIDNANWLTKFILKITNRQRLVSQLTNEIYNLTKLPEDLPSPEPITKKKINYLHLINLANFPFASYFTNQVQKEQLQFRRDTQRTKISNNLRGSCCLKRCFNLTSTKKFRDLFFQSSTEDLENLIIKIKTMSIDEIVSAYNYDQMIELFKFSTSTISLLVTDKLQNQDSIDRASRWVKDTISNKELSFCNFLLTIGAEFDPNFLIEQLHSQGHEVTLGLVDILLKQCDERKLKLPETLLHILLVLDLPNNERSKHLHDIVKRVLEMHINPNYWVSEQTALEMHISFINNFPPGESRSLLIEKYKPILNMISDYTKNYNRQSV